MILLHDLSVTKDKSNRKSNVFCYLLNNIGFLMKEKLVSTVSVLFLWCSRLKIHFYVAAPLFKIIFRCSTPKRKHNSHPIYLITPSTVSLILAIVKMFFCWITSPDCGIRFLYSSVSDKLRISRSIAFYSDKHLKPRCTLDCLFINVFYKNYESKI
jgi:hypothetical protein